MDGEERDPVDSGPAREGDAAAPGPQAPPPAYEGPPEGGFCEDERPPDPDESFAEEGQPHCLKCLEPFGPLQDHCLNCGWGVGQLTLFKPFEMIRPAYYFFFGNMWKKAWYEEAPFIVKVLCLLLIGIQVPIMFVGLPFVLFEKPKQDQDPAQQDGHPAQ